jgi:hypothetical protein
MTVTPCLTASGAKARETDPPALKMAKSRPAKASGLASWTVQSFPAYWILEPAERAEARGRSSVTGKFLFRHK